MSEEAKIVLTLLVPLAVIVAVVLMELLRVASSKRRRDMLRNRIENVGVAATVVDLLQSHRRERPMGTAAAGSVVQLELQVHGPEWIRSATDSTGTTTAARPVSTTKYVGAVPAFARPMAPERAAEQKR
jgi:hypothetical protein